MFIPFFFIVVMDLVFLCSEVSPISLKKNKQPLSLHSRFADAQMPADVLFYTVCHWAPPQ